jgi:hypothetical protein
MGQANTSTNKPYFIEEIPLNKIKCLLNANSELLVEVGDFIKQSTELQNVLSGSKTVHDLSI